MKFLSPHYLPYVLIALVLLGLAVLFNVLLRRKTFQALSFGQEEPPAFQTTTSKKRRRWRFIAAGLIVLLIAVTLLRPFNGFFLRTERLPARNLVLVVDVSKSMGCPDAEGLTRLEAAKFFSRSLIEALPSERIGILSFSGTSFPECPLTIDRTVLRRRLDLLSPGMNANQGTDLSSALEQAVDLLTEEPPPGSALVLLSDGDRLISEDSSLLKKLAELKVPVHTVSFGDPGTESPVPGSEDDSTSKADPALMARIAETTQGVALEASTASTDASIARIQTALDSLSIDGLPANENIRQRPNEIFFYPLTLAVGLLFFRLALDPRTAESRRLFASLILIGFLTLTSTTQAQERVYPAFEEAKAAALERKLPLLLIFTASDWSETSIVFQREILNHETFQSWVSFRVQRLDIDLPRSGLDEEERSARRELAKRYQVTGYPTTVFVEPKTNEILGRLQHEPDGPATWIRNADRILAGDYTASNSPSRIKDLPVSELKTLEDESLPADLRSSLHYNRAIEELRIHEKEKFASQDRSKLVIALLKAAAQLALPNHPELAGQAYTQLAKFSHLDALTLAKPPEAPEGDEASEAPPAPDRRPWKDIVAKYKSAKDFHRKAIQASPASPDLPKLLAKLENDLEFAELNLSFKDRYKETVESFELALQAENDLARAAQQWSVVTRPLNDANIEASLTKLAELHSIAKRIRHRTQEQIQEAEEDALLVPDAHTERDFTESEKHLSNALNHLLENQPKGSGPGGDKEEPRSDQGDESGRAKPKSRDNGAQERNLEDSRGRRGDLIDRLREKNDNQDKRELPDH